VETTFLARPLLARLAGTTAVMLVELDAAWPFLIAEIGPLMSIVPSRASREDGDEDEPPVVHPPKAIAKNPSTKMWGSLETRKWTRVMVAPSE